MQNLSLMLTSVHDSPRVHVLKGTAQLHEVAPRRPTGKRTGSK